MKIIEIADSVGDIYLEKYNVFITDYEDSGYNGEGIAVGISFGENLVDVFNLSHCSCYSPFDDTPKSYSIQDFTDAAESPNLHDSPFFHSKNESKFKSIVMDELKNKGV